jgi:hypothetical protein
MKLVCSCQVREHAKDKLSRFPGLKAIGRFNPKIMMGQIGSDVIPYKKLPGFPPKMSGPGGCFYGITIAGQGHVLCYNHVAYFVDGISLHQGGSAMATKHGGPQSNVDFYNNFIFNTRDNFFETDTGSHNLRVMRNLCINNGHGGCRYMDLGRNQPERKILDRNRLVSYEKDLVDVLLLPSKGAVAAAGKKRRAEKVPE